MCAEKEMNSSYNEYERKICCCKFVSASHRDDLNC